MNSIPLNAVVATLVLVMALCAAFLDLLTDPKESHWPALPLLIRWEIRATACAFVVRGVNLYSISSKPLQLGQVNIWAVIASVSLMVTVVSITVYAVSLKLPFRAWDRLRFARGVMRRNGDMVPLMVARDEITSIAHASGQPAVGPGESPRAVDREGPRAARMRERNS